MQALCRTTEMQFLGNCDEVAKLTKVGSGLHDDNIYPSTQSALEREDARLGLLIS